MSIVLMGTTSGSCTLQEQAVAGTTTLTLPTFNGTVGLLVSGTAVASTSGTSIDFTGIPAGVRRITVMLDGVSLSGTSNILLRLGTGSTTYVTTGYNDIAVLTGGASTNTTSTGGFLLYDNAASASANHFGMIVFTNINGNNWVCNGQAGLSTRNIITWTSGSLALGATLTAVRVTTANGTDTFDAGTINILYEG
jgi:hypothetical protein